MTATGNYTVKVQPTLNISAVKDPVRFGDNITITGNITPSGNSSTVNVQFSSSNSTQIVDATVTQNGNFTATFKADSWGAWSVQRIRS